MKVMNTQGKMVWVRPCNKNASVAAVFRYLIRWELYGGKGTNREFMCNSLGYATGKNGITVEQLEAGQRAIKKLKQELKPYPLSVTLHSWLLEATASGVKHIPSHYIQQVQLQLYGNWELMLHFVVAIKEGQFTTNSEVLSWTHPKLQKLNAKVMQLPVQRISGRSGTVVLSDQC